MLMLAALIDYCSQVYAVSSQKGGYLCKIIGSIPGLGIEDTACYTWRT